MKISEFCKKYDAYSDLEKRMRKFKNMDDFFTTCRDHDDDVIWAVTRKDVLSEKNRISFACWCVRQIWHLLKDDRSKNAVIVAEKYVNGNATEYDFMVASKEAMHAAYDADKAMPAGNFDISNVSAILTYALADASYAAARAAGKIVYTVYGCADAVVYAIRAETAVANLTVDVDITAIRTAAHAAGNAAKKSQVEYLRENFSPNWEDSK